MRKKGFVGILLAALLMSACSKGGDTPVLSVPDSAEQGETADEAGTPDEDETADEAEMPDEDETADEAGTPDREGSADPDDAQADEAGGQENASGDDGASGEERIFGTYVETFHCGYLFQSTDPKPWIMYRVSTEEEIMYAEVYLGMMRPLNADDSDPDEWVNADAFQDMMAKYPSSQYDYLFYYTQYSQGGHSHHADYLFCENGVIRFHYDSVTKPQGGYSTDMMDGEIDMAAVPKKFFEGRHFNNLYQVESLWLGKDDDPVDPGYIASFHGGVGEQTEETYVYETEDGYHYVNVESTTVSWGSPKWNHMILSYGDLETKEEVIEHAKYHGASQYILFPGDNDPHPIEDFLTVK